MHSVPIEDSANGGLDAVTHFEDDFEASVQQLVDEIAELYLSDAIPWVVGYSGGKDSTATLQLVWMALERLGPEQRTKPVHVISTDTLVENPIVAAWVGRSLDRMNEAAESAGLPISSHRLTPAVRDTFWVNLIGRGYPAPRPKFRWCTERLKILPSHRFIKSMVDRHGETILVLGTRKAESAARAAVMERYEAGRIRGRLSPTARSPTRSSIRRSKTGRTTRSGCSWSSTRIPGVTRTVICCRCTVAHRQTESVRSSWIPGRRAAATADSGAGSARWSRRTVPCRR